MIERGGSVTPVELRTSLERGATLEAQTEISETPRTIVLQPTPLCNLRCTYCYLGDLGNGAKMDPAITEGIAADLERNILPQVNTPTPSEESQPRSIHGTAEGFEVILHGGEPLAVGVDHMSRLLEPLEDLPVNLSLQTNATLISPKWINLFEKYKVRVGVSIDGPRDRNRHRLTKSGAETHDRAMRGIELLKEHGRPFSAIAVVPFDAIPDIIKHVDEYLGFFYELGASQIGFNLEEHEGNNENEAAFSQSAKDLATKFWTAIFETALAKNEGLSEPPALTDMLRILEAIRAKRSGPESLVDPLADPFPTITVTGDVVLLAPELAGAHSERYNDFVVGNVLDDPLSTILKRALGPNRPASIVDFILARETCRQECDYYSTCLALGQASNRFFEHGNLAVNETAFCRTRDQAGLDALDAVYERNKTLLSDA